MATEKLPLPLGGGVNLHSDPTALADSQWQRLRNLAQAKNGVVGQRQSMTFARDINPTMTEWNAHQSATIPKYYEWAKTIRPVKFIFDSNFGELVVVFITTADTTYWSVSTTATSLKTAPEGTFLLVVLPNGVTVGDNDELCLKALELGTVQRAPSVITFNGITYAWTGGTAGGQLGPELASGMGPGEVGLTRPDFGSGNTDFYPDGAAVVRDRVVYYIGSNLYWSDKNAPLVVGSTGTIASGNITPSTAKPPVGTNFPAIGVRDVYLGGEDNEPITAIAEINTTAQGSPNTSVCMVYTKQSAFMVQGEPLETTQGGDIVGNLQINKLNIQCGCQSQATICRTPYGTIWAGVNDVWFMPFGSLPIPIGTTLRPYLENLPAGVAWKLHAEYYDGKYRLSLPKDGQDTDGSSPLGVQFWLDLQAGPPQSAAEARWFGPQEFVQPDAPTSAGATGGSPGVWCMALDKRGNGDGKLYALQPYWLTGGADRVAVVGMSLCSFDAFDGRDTCAPQMEPQPWAAGTAYDIGAIVVPTPGSTVGTGLCAPAFICTTAGTSDATDEPTWYTLSALGDVSDGSVEWTSIYFDVDTGDTLSAYSAKISQQTNHIEWSMLSKEFAMGDPTKEKLLSDVELGYWAGGPCYVTYNSHPNQDIRSRTLYPVNDTLTPNQLSAWTGARVWQRRLLTPTPTKRFNALTATWECKHTAGLLVVEGLNQIFSIRLNGVDIDIEVPAAYYANLAALDTQLLNQLNADTLGVFASTISEGLTTAVYGIRETTGESFQLYLGDGGLSESFGFTRAQGSPNAGTTTQYILGAESPRWAIAHPMQLSALFLNYSIFNRGPT